MKRLVLFLLLGLLGASAFAQESPLRDKGYKGSVSVSYAYPVYAGIETSHGYMFNLHHYQSYKKFYALPKLTTVSFEF